jgi:hypothetical protein
LLATIDPVDGSHGHTAAQAAWLDHNLGGLWVDVRATSYEHSTIWNEERSDRIAGIGGRMGTAAQSQADTYLTMNVNHADFRQMLNGAQVGNMVSSIYNNWKRK